MPRSGVQDRRASSSFPADLVLHGLVPTLDFALGLRVERGTADVTHFMVVQPFGKIARDVTGSIIAQQARHVPNNGLVASRCCQGQLNCISHILGSHVGAKLPCDDIAAVIIQDCAKIIPAPADDLEVVKSVCHISLLVVVLSVNSSAALMTT